MKRILKYIGVLFAVSLIAALGYILYQKAYKGTEKIILLDANKPYTPLNELLKSPPFKNKVVYIDIWGTTCPPCFDELKNYTPALTKKYAGNSDIVFLYLCLDRHPLPDIRWKEKIRLLRPVGYHILLDEQKENLLAEDILGHKTTEGFFPYIPCYIIVNKNGQILQRPTEDPESTDLPPSAKDQLYKKLDSLLALK